MLSEGYVVSWAEEVSTGLKVKSGICFFPSKEWMLVWDLRGTWRFEISLTLPTFAEAT